mgnify:FL=1|jgi:hypothetical protein
MPELEPLYPSYLPKRIRACPQCRKSADVQVIIYGMPAGPPGPEERDRVLFAGCVMPVCDDPDQEPPKWYCPTCGVSYTGRGEIVPEQDEW